jgi:hypothetical protein
VALGDCTKPCAEIKFDITETPSQGKGSWVQGQVVVSEEISFVPQLLCTRCEKCGKSEWSWSDGRKNGSHLDECNTVLQIPERALSSHKHRGDPAKNLVILRNAQKPYAAHVAFVQAL